MDFKKEYDMPWGVSVRYSREVPSRTKRSFSYLEEYIMSKGFVKVNDETRDGLSILGFEKANRRRTLDAISIGIDTKNSQLRMAYDGSKQNKGVMSKAIELVEKRYG